MRDHRPLKLKNERKQWDITAQKGRYGEDFVKLFLKKYGIKIKRPPEGSYSEDFTLLSKKEYLDNSLETCKHWIDEGLFKNCKEVKEQLEREYETHRKECAKIKSKYGDVCLPDFKIANRKVFIEVKTGKYAELEQYQSRSYPKILKKGYKIIIARPELKFEKNLVVLKDVKWFEYLGYGKKRRAINIFDFLENLELEEK